MAGADLTERVVNVLVERYKGRKRRDEVRACCPIHAGKHARTFSFNIGKRVWQCFKCDARGGVVEIARFLDILSPAEGDRRKLAGIRRRVVGAHWPGMAGATDREVMIALLGLAMRVGKSELTCSHRQLAELAGVGRVTVGASLKRLRKAGWLACLERGSNREASAWRLRVPQKLHPDRSTRVLRPSEGCSGINLVHPSHDSFRWKALGKNGRRLLELLATKDWRVNDLAAAAGLHRNTVTRFLNKCARSGLVAQIGKQWACTIAEASLDAVAQDCGTAGDSERARSQHAAERLSYRWRFEVAPPREDVAGDVIVLRRPKAA